jgi:hypothetical protein
MPDPQVNDCGTQTLPINRNNNAAIGSPLAFQVENFSNAVGNRLR